MSANLKPDFFEFVKTSQTALAHLASVVREYAAGKALPNNAPTDGPRKWAVGEDHPLHTSGISAEDLDAITKMEADSVVMDKFIEFVKGLIIGSMHA